MSPSMQQARLQRSAIPADQHLSASMQVQGAALVQLRMRSEDAEDAVKAAKAAVTSATVRDANILRDAARDPKATPASLAKASRAQHEAAALEVLERATRASVACVEVQAVEERRWTSAMRKSAAARVEVTQSLCDESAVPLRKAVAAVLAARSVYLSHVVALGLALDDLSPNEHTNIAPATWRPSTKSEVRFAPGGTSDRLDLSKLERALTADSHRHVAPPTRQTDDEQQGDDESAVMAGRK